MDFESWRLIDPSREGKDEVVFQNRKAEEEIRAEMDREATMLKAKQKLSERLGSETLLP